MFLSLVICHLTILQMVLFEISFSCKIADTYQKKLHTRKNFYRGVML